MNSLEGIRLDLHIGILPQTKPEYVQKCLSSVTEAARRSPFPVEVHVLPGVVGHIGKLRQQGYALGTAPYVCRVDDDDYIDPDAFMHIARGLRERAAVVWPMELVLHQATGKLRLGQQRHAMAVFRRELLIDVSDYTRYADTAQIFSLYPQPAVDIKEPCYIWRTHHSNSRILIPFNDGERQRARAELPLPLPEPLP